MYLMSQVRGSTLWAQVYESSPLPTAHLYGIVLKYGRIHMESVHRVQVCDPPMQAWQIWSSSLFLNHLLPEGRKRMWLRTCHTQQIDKKQWEAAVDVFWPVWRWLTGWPLAQVHCSHKAHSLKQQVLERGGESTWHAPGMWAQQGGLLCLPVHSPGVELKKKKWVYLIGVRGRIRMKSLAIVCKVQRVNAEFPVCPTCPQYLLGS